MGDCENGRQAVEFVQSHKVDVVLTDICMPYMDGMELSEFLHDTIRIFLLLYSAVLGNLNMKKAIRYNVSEYMLKPVHSNGTDKSVWNMKKEKAGFQKKKRTEKMESLSQTSKDYHKNVDVIRSKALETLCKLYQEMYR